MANFEQNSYLPPSFQGIKQRKSHQGSGLNDFFCFIPLSRGIELELNLSVLCSVTGPWVAEKNGK